jgi:hypothetical protein
MSIAEPKAPIRWELELCLYSYGPPDDHGNVTLVEPGQTPVAYDVELHLLLPDTGQTEILTERSFTDANLAAAFFAALANIFPHASQDI